MHALQPFDPEVRRARHVDIDSKFKVQDIGALTIITCSRSSSAHMLSLLLLAVASFTGLGAGSRP